MRVLLIYHFFGPYHLARWNHWQDFARLEGFEPLALQLFKQPDLYQWRPEAYSDSGIYNLGLATGGQDNLQWRDVPKLMAVLDRLRPDVVVINGWGMRDAVLIHFWSKLRGIKRIVVSDSQEIDFTRSVIKEFIKRKILSGVGSAFVAGDSHRRYVEALGVASSRTTDGCDVVDNAHFLTALSLRRQTGYRVLSVARLAEQKNLLVAGRAFLRFVAMRPASELWKWSIAGYGPLEPQIRAMVRASKGRIRLLGAVDYEALPATYGDADLYWQPSRREPWGLAVNEAMASGLPVVVSERCGCHENLVTSETGWTFDPLSEDDMVRVLNTAADARPHWPLMGKASTELIGLWGLERFSRNLNQAVHLATNSERRP